LYAQDYTPDSNKHNKGFLKNTFQKQQLE